MIKISNIAILFTYAYLSYNNYSTYNFFNRFFRIFFCLDAKHTISFFIDRKKFGRVLDTKTFFLEKIHRKFIVCIVKITRNMISFSHIRFVHEKYAGKNQDYFFFGWHFSGRLTSISREGGSEIEEPWTSELFLGDLKISYEHFTKETEKKFTDFVRKNNNHSQSSRKKSQWKPSPMNLSRWNLHLSTHLNTPRTQLHTAWIKLKHG